MLVPGIITAIPPHPVVEDLLEPRFCEAWRIAFEVAGILREKYHAEDVRVIGSLLDRERFHEDSDIDLAITNFTVQQTFDIGHELEKYHPWKIDLIPLLSVYPEKRSYILARSESIGTLS
jgi:predicted nucleotidyltransferase